MLSEERLKVFIIAYGKEKSVAEYHLTFPVEKPKISYFTVHTHTLSYIRIQQNKPRVTTTATVFMKEDEQREPFLELAGQRPALLTVCSQLRVNNHRGRISAELPQAN